MHFLSYYRKLCFYEIPANLVIFFGNIKLNQESLMKKEVAKKKFYFPYIEKM